MYVYLKYNQKEVNFKARALYYFMLIIEKCANEAKNLSKEINELRDSL